MKTKPKMEFNLFKTLTNFDISKEESFSMDNGLPGIGQLVQDYSFIVPLHSHSDLTTMEKKSNLDVDNDQTGAGQDESESNETTITDSIDKNGLNSKEKEPLEFNERKRKNMDEGVYQSFLNSKMFKTNSVKVFPKGGGLKHEKSETSTKIDKEVEKVPNKIEKEKKQIVKHKFNVY
jgi:hypothetical protein